MGCAPLFAHPTYSIRFIQSVYFFIVCLTDVLFAFFYPQEDYPIFFEASDLWSWCLFPRFLKNVIPISDLLVLSVICNKIFIHSRFIFCHK